MLQIYNSLSGNKEPFIPIHPHQVRMYVCGMTVYDYCHLGHARVLVVFDTVVRYLRSVGFAVTYVRNITDIDDKIIRRAAENGESIASLTSRFIDAMREDAAALGNMPPDLEPKATESIDLIITMIESLLSKGYAYCADNGDVYYAVSQFVGYGKLSGKKPEELLAGSRVEIDHAKRNPLDFVLWKAAKPGEPSWSSPWGEGRPGWHIECSAMSTQHLGNHFDIHGGGMDLQFPHHENEIAQSEGATGEPFVNYWMHNGFVRINEEKMSKSLNNFFTVRQVLAQYNPETVRYFILNSHYRSPLNYSEQQLDSAHQALTRLYTALRGVSALAGTSEFSLRFTQAMEDDFNTPEALAVLFDLAKAINRHKELDPQHAACLAGELKALGHVLGILQSEAEDFLQHAGLTTLKSELSTSEIEDFIAARQAARKAKNFAQADHIRDDLAAHGIILEDAAGLTTWRRQ